MSQDPIKCQLSGSDIQLIWLATWYLASRPLLAVSSWWHRQKLTVLSRDKNDEEAAKLILGMAENSSEWQMLGAAIAAAASLVVPIIRALFHA